MSHKFFYKILFFQKEFEIYQIHMFVFLTECAQSLFSQKKVLIKKFCSINFFINFNNLFFIHFHRMITQLLMVMQSEIS